MSPLRLRGPASRLTVGESTNLGRVEIHLLDRVSIAHHVVVNDGVVILTGSHDIMCPDYSHVVAPVVIDEYAWVATGATILPGVHIGQGAVVGAGAVVARDVEPYSVVAGNPAKVIRTGRTASLNYSPFRWSAAIESWVGRTDAQPVSGTR